MFLQRGIVCILFLLCVSAQGADSQYTPAVSAWVRLAQDLQNGKIGYFYLLPLDVQANIFSRIHPQPSLDDWQSNNALCVKHITVPHHILSFDINGDRLAYMGKKDKNSAGSSPYWIDLKTDNFHAPLHKGEERECLASMVPAVKLCGDVIVFEEHRQAGQDLAGLSEKNLYAVNIFDKPIGGSIYPFIVLQHGMNSTDIWCAHTSMQRIVFSEQVHDRIHYHFYEMTDKATINCGHHTHVFGSPADVKIDKTFVWHPYVPQLYMYGHTQNDITLFDKKGSMQPTGCEKILGFGPNSYGDTYYINGIQSRPYFSPDGKSFYAKHQDGLLKYDIAAKESSILSLSAAPNSLALRGVGRRTYLVEEVIAGDNNKGDGRYILGCDASIPLTEFNNAPQLHKLPSGNDARYVTVVVDEKMSTSTIKISVPLTPVLFQHYCMLNAVLELKKNDKAKGWELFDLEENKCLVQGTKNGYALFDQEMPRKKS